MLDYKAEFELPFAMCKDSRQKIAASKEDFWEDRGQHWTVHDVVDEILRIHRAGGGLRRKLVPVSLYEVGRRTFGTWRAAVEAAGLDYEEVTGVRRWTRKQVIERIKKLAADGVPLSSTYIGRRYHYLHRAARRLFPNSWSKALRAAGFDPNVYKVQRGYWHRGAAEDWVRAQVAAGRPILARDAPRDLVQFVQRRLGTSWTDFVESLGVPYPGIKRRHDWTKRKLLEEIRRWAAEGHPLNYSAVQESYQALIHQSRKFFGSWDGARAAARV